MCISELLVEAHFSINFFDKTNHLAISKSQLKQEQPVVVEVTQVFSPQLLEIEIQFFSFRFIGNKPASDKPEDHSSL